MSFSRHGEIYLPMRSSALGRSWPDIPSPHWLDEFPDGYSLAGCAPTEPASTSPASTHVEGSAMGSAIERQRTAKRPLTVCLTQGDTPQFDHNNRHNNRRYFRPDPPDPAPELVRLVPPDPAGHVTLGRLPPAVPLLA